MKSNNPLAEILSALRSVTHHEATRKGDSFVTLCPCHDDKRPSLYVTPKGDTALIYCQSCKAGFEQVMRKVGLWKDSAKADRTHIYRDENGRPLFQVLVTGSGDNKDVRQRRWDGTKWIGGTGCMTGVRRVLYRLPELLRADPEEIVFICEGEKDADRLAELELVATTNPQGAGNFGSVDPSPLRGRICAIMRDNDEAGEKHVRDVAKRLHEIAAEIRIVSLPDLPHKGDVSDWLDAGHGKDLPAVFLRIHAEGGELIKSDAGAPEPPAAGAGESSPQPEPALLLMSDVQAEPVRWLWTARIALGKVTLIAGDPGLGKSFLTLDLAARVSRGRAFPDCDNPNPAGHVVLISAEDDAADTIRPRLDAAGADVDARIHPARHSY
jgi:putative DNA primase/helicase